MTKSGRRPLLAVAFVIVVAVATPPFHAASPALDPAADAALARLLAEKVAGGVPAVVVGVVNPERMLIVKAAGERDRAAHAPLAADAIFRIASMTKPVTSLAAMILVEEGRLRLDDPVAKYLPEFERARVLVRVNADKTAETRPASRPVTVRDLLTHTSGLVYSFVDGRFDGLKDARTTLAHDPGARFSYGPSTGILGAVIEKASGRGLDLFVNERIFDPAGMRDTAYVVPADKRDRLVTMHARGDGGRMTERPNPAAPSSTVAGDGGLFSTAADYGRFLQIFLNGGRAGQTRIVSAQTIRDMLANQIGSLRVEQQPSADVTLSKPFPLGAGKDTFGFGFQLESGRPTPGLRSTGSGSWGGIFNTHFWIDPQRQIGVIVLMQFLPYYDDQAIDVVRSVERLVYAHLKASS